MKINILLFITSLFITSTIFSQSSSIADIDEHIAQMRSELHSYQKIEKIKTDSTSKDIYLMDGEVQIITIVEKGKIEKHVEWYYTNGILLYTETNWTVTSSQGNMLNHKTYHNNGAMIAWLDGENSFVNASTTKYKQFEKAVNEYSKKIRTQALE
jgi:prepilin-type processing-associated H-X9-DG protein